MDASELHSGEQQSLTDTAESIWTSSRKSEHTPFFRKKEITYKDNFGRYERKTGQIWLQLHEEKIKWTKLIIYVELTSISVSCYDIGEI